MKPKSLLSWLANDGTNKQAEPSFDDLVVLQGFGEVIDAEVEVVDAESALLRAVDRLVAARVQVLSAAQDCGAWS